MVKSPVMKKLVCVLLIISMLVPLCACGESKTYTEQIFAMDTTMSLTAYGNNAKKGISNAISVIQALDAAVDPDLETGITYQINNANGQNVTVSGQIADMLTTAKEIYEQTDGAYDITIYPLVKRWGFTTGQYVVPSENEIANDLAKLCMGELTINKFPNSGTYTISLPFYGNLSFASCAKGCASKYAIEAMKNVGVSSAVISLGGNVQTLGVKPDGTNWKIGIQDPYNTSSYLASISVGETAVVTSGTYQRFFTAANGKTYHHLFSTKTGYPITNGLVSVTVVCEDGTKADCLSTAMFALGKTSALNYWRKYGGFDMIMIDEDHKITCTSGLIEKFELKNNNYTLSFVE